MLNVETCGLTDAMSAFAVQSTSAVETVGQALQRVNRFNDSVNALSEVLFETANREAVLADRLLANSAKTASPTLAGVPIAVKDNIDTVPAICSSGLPFLEDYAPQSDADVVRRLRRAGAVVIGVTETDPGAFGVRTPKVQHPQAPKYNVGGSSGGSAAAVAAGFALGSLGTDTGGSIRIPAACCSLTGFKPTYGRVSLQGIRPLAYSLDHVGPIARRVPDLIELQKVLDPHLRLPVPQDWACSITVGYDLEYYADADPDVQQAMRDLLDRMQAEGYTLVEVRLPTPAEALACHMINLPSEAAAYHFRTFPDYLESYPEVARETLAMARKYHGYEYVQAEQDRAAARKTMDGLFREVDLVLVPTLPVRAPLRGATTITLGDCEYPTLLALIRYTCLFNQTGHPVVTMPVTERDGDGRSVSLQIVGRRGGDGVLLANAARIEDMLGLKFKYSIQRLDNMD